MKLPQDQGRFDEVLKRQLGELRRFKDKEILRIAIQDIAGPLSLGSVQEQLTDLAEALLERSLSLAETEASAQGKAPSGRLCVVGMGTLGVGHESSRGKNPKPAAEGSSTSSSPPSSCSSPTARPFPRSASPPHRWPCGG